MIDFKELDIKTNYKKEIKELIDISNLSLKHWTTYWTGFNPTFICDEILKEFENLNDFKFLFLEDMPQLKDQRLHVSEKIISKTKIIL